MFVNRMLPLGGLIPAPLDHYRRQLAEIEESIQVDEYNRAWRAEMDRARDLIGRCRDDYTRSALWRSFELAKDRGLMMDEACRRTFGPSSRWDMLCR